MSQNKKIDKTSQKETMKKVLRRIKKYWFFLGLSMVMAAVTVASTLYVPILVGKAIDDIIEIGRAHV